MSTHLNKLWRGLLLAAVYFCAQTQSQCVEVYVEFAQIQAGLDASDWRGTYIVDGTQQAGCPRYTSSSGQTLRYSSTAWILSSADGDPLALTSASCDGFLGSNHWQHGQDVNDSVLTIT